MDLRHRENLRLKLKLKFKNKMKFLLKRRVKMMKNPFYRRPRGLSRVEVHSRKLFMKSKLEMNTLNNDDN